LFGRECVEEAGGGRKRERKRETTGNARIPAVSVSVSGQRSGRRSDLSDITDSVSKSRCLSQSPAGERRRRTRGRERDEVETRERERERERDIFF
jgi:hypothetical protein